MKPPIKNMVLKMHPHGDVTQWFAENPKLYAFLDLDGHNGIDLVRPHGEQMYAVEDAEVLEVKDTPEGYGRHIRILSLNKNRRGYYNEWTYGHCHTIQVPHVYATFKISQLTYAHTRNRRIARHIRYTRL
jgi:murein DD-endopeptidase MepM/ murein hydrolase activator NlpD